MNQADFTARYDALQDELLTLYEAAPTDINSQIRHWQLTRQLNVLMYYCRKEGLKSLGLQTLPTLQISEYNSKAAIKMVLLLQSLAKSQYGSEPWSLSDTSIELVLTSPKNTFKKHGFQVEVFYDGNPNNANVYTQWESIYYQDLNDVWHKVPGEVDHNGLSYTDVTGERNYFLLFSEDAERYSQTGLWTVKYKNTTISSVVTSSSRHSSNTKESQQPISSPIRESLSEAGTSGGRRSERDTEERLPTTTTASPSSSGGRRRRGGERGEQGEYPTSTRESPRSKRQRTTAPTPSEVGRRHRSVPPHNLDRLRRLQEEARDPPLICVKGSANLLKCWRQRSSVRFGHLYDKASSVFRWIGDDDETKFNSRMLIAFTDFTQRAKFLQVVTFPRGSTFSLGSLDKL
uniref:Regulatory protein E2 n=1 Tax=Human papillomavirus TaxID=10566 RepID=H2BQD1_9PAPI|nr:E2 protein [Human papillomavirus]